MQRRYTLTDPFGELTPTTPTGTDTRLGFDGQYNDPLSGSYHLRARDCGTRNGRFQSVDPVRNGFGTSCWPSRPPVLHQLPDAAASVSVARHAQAQKTFNLVAAWSFRC